MLVGILWAALAPLLLLIPTFILAAALKKTSLRKSQRYSAAGFFVFAITLAIWLPDRLAFSKFCENMGPTQIYQKTSVNGFFLDDPTANSFGMRYLYDEGFKWIEAKSIYHPGKFTRYEMTDGKISETEIDQPQSQFMMKAETTNLLGYSVSGSIISSMDSRVILAMAKSAHFDGGRSKVVLGAWGTAQCPDPRSAEGSKQFQKFYHLAQMALSGLEIQKNEAEHRARVCLEAFQRPVGPQDRVSSEAQREKNGFAFWKVTMSHQPPMPEGTRFMYVYNDGKLQYVSHGDSPQFIYKEGKCLILSK